jgi:alkanesulfonate monooxygenase SsuD/methylene tetrahydromethanopterin reductase-like flavin-dependent oxidoreductase (luciferase family)
MPGRHYRLETPVNLPAPVQRGGTPVLVGAVVEMVRGL